MKIALDDIEQAIRTLNRQVDELAVRRTDQLAAFGRLQAERTAFLGDLNALHRENLAAAGRMRARLDHIADRIDAIRNALTLTS